MVIEEIGRNWPDCFSREKASELVGGVISPRSLANLDCLGLGPERRLRVGRKIVYTRESFVEWFKRRIKEVS